jgi:alkanesulfonate monooxygenase SsuD/methylene tetrahydromethanopterin reductase-like flavin-dependent oxidoreductase (luciferase family)
MKTSPSLSSASPIVSASLAHSGEPRVLHEFAALVDRHGLDFLVLDGPADALITASWLIPATTRLGLVPSLPTSHAQPFHAARALASMDTLSGGRMGWLPTSLSPAEVQAAFGPANALSPSSATAKAMEYVAAAQALWDSWDADALIIDKVSAVYLDSAKIRRVDFRSEHFRVLGPLNAARPPQGYPVLVADDFDPSFARSWHRADVLLVGAATPAAAQERIAALRSQGAQRILAKVRCGVNSSARSPDSSSPPALESVGDAAQIWGQWQDWQRTLGYDGVHLLSAGDTGNVVTLLPQLLSQREPQATAKPSDTLRARLGLPLPLNRYSAA